MIANTQLVDIFLITEGVLLVIQLFYYLYFYSAVGFDRFQRKKNTHVPVSVIICARNENKNLKQFLPLVLSQDYPNYEVVVVNDASTDDTSAVLESFAEKYKILRYTTITKDERFTHGKKLALLVGIKAAKNEWLLFTDADCKPASDQWIRIMARNFTKKTSIVLAYGGFVHKKGLLNNFIRYEAFFIAIQYLGFASRGHPYMGVGRNMAYRKPLYFQISKRKYFSRLLSGDDDLLVNLLANKNNTRIETDPRACTLSEPPMTWKRWFRNKKRHITTARYYTRGSRWLLGGELISRVFFWLLAGTLFFFPVSWMVPAAVILLRWIVMGIVLSQAQKRLQEKQLLLSSLIYDILIPFFYLITWVSNLSRTAEILWE